MSEIKFTRGQIVEVRDEEEQEWRQRVFIAYIPGTKLPFATIYESDINDAIALLETPEEIDIESWKYCQKASAYITKTIELSAKYTAEIKRDRVVVGCQEILFEKIHKVYEAVVAAENFKEPE